MRRSLLLAAVGALVLAGALASASGGAQTPRILTDFTLTATNRTETLHGGGRSVVALRAKTAVTTSATGRFTLVDGVVFHKHHLVLVPVVAKTLVGKAGGTVNVKVTQSDDSDCPVGRMLILVFQPSKSGLHTVILHPLKSCSSHNYLWTNTLEGATVRIVIHSRIG